MLGCRCRSFVISQRKLQTNSRYKLKVSDDPALQHRPISLLYTSGIALAMKFDHARWLIAGVFSLFASNVAGVVIQSPSTALIKENQQPAIAAVAPEIAALPPSGLAGNQPLTPLAQAAARKVESCLIQTAIINDPNPPLNVRSAPTTQSSRVLTQLKNGTIVTVTEEKEGWFRISVPIKGWLAKQRTVYSCNQKVERVTVASTTPMTIADRFIGGGTHKYRLSANKGQKLTIIRKNGPFPTLIAPDGKILVGTPDDEDRPQWSGQLAQTGDYVMRLDSNFKGYQYAFQVELK